MRSILLLPLLGACAFGASQPAPVRYTLALPDAPAPAGLTESNRPVVAVERPLAAFGLDSERIQVQKPDGSFSHAEGAAWAEALPDLVQSALRAALEAQARAFTFIDNRTGARAEARLNVTLERFTVHYGENVNAQPAIELRAGIQLIRTADGAVLAAETYSVVEEAEANRMDAILRACNENFRGLTRRIAQILEQSKADLRVAEVTDRTLREIP